MENNLKVADSAMIEFPTKSVLINQPSMIPRMKGKIYQAQQLLTDEDYFQKAFLKPIEVSLKNEGLGLPTGFNLVLKDDISANKFKTTTFQTPDIQEWSKMTYEQMIEQNYDNLLSLLKSSQGIQLAICVCMYSEDKKMLKNTLTGISENIDLFVKGGISTDKIAVFVIMDGIQKVHPSIVEYFDELERESSIMLGQQHEPMGLHDFLFSKNIQEERYEDQVTNINRILFTEAELFERQEKRFRTRVEEYAKIKDLVENVQKLKKQKTLTYDTLDPRVQDFFIEVARERRKQQYGEDQDQLKVKEKQFFVDQYAYDVVRSRPIMMEALNRTKKYCEEYIKSRQSLALMNYFRTGVFIKKQETITDEKGKTIVLDAQDNETRIGATRMNLFLCTKYKNSGKLSSHNWFFNGFCKELVPKYAVLLDVGLKPEKNALYKMYEHMRQKPDVGGVCGYMGLRIERAQDQLGYNEQLNEEQDIDCFSRVILKFVDVQRAQQMEYHIAHLIDKSFESQFDFIHVLPGAFSAYNMEALHANNLLEEYFESLQSKINNNTIVPSRFSAKEAILKTIIPDSLYFYFWPLHQKSQEQLLYNQNIYLAEDRILCMGIHQNGKNMAFLPDAYAWVDPIKNVHTLLGQRKRWINGSFFAFDKVKSELSKQDEWEPALRFQMMYLSLMNTLAYVAPALFLFTVSIAIQVFKQDVLQAYLSDLLPPEFMDGMVFVINFIYIAVTLSMIFFSMHLTNKNKKYIPYIYVAAVVMGIFSIIVFVILMVDIFRGSTSFLVTNPNFVQSLPFSVQLLDSIRWIIIAIIMMYAFPITIYCTMYRRFSFAADCVFGAFSFLFFTPTYLNILNIYALCRINDISWGTKGLEDTVSSSKNAAMAQTWSVIRLIHVGKYLLWNIIAGMILLTLGAQYITRFIVTFSIMLILGLSMMIKVTVGMWYLISYFFSKRIPDPPEDATYNQDSRVNDFYVIIKPEIEQNVKQNLDNRYEEIQSQLKQGPRSNVIWGGKSNILAPGKKKEALKKQFQILNKLNASRIIRKELPPPDTQFRGKYRAAQDKNKYKRNRTGQESSNGNTSRDQLNATNLRPSNSKDKYKKYRQVVQIKTNNDPSLLREKPANSKDMYRKASSIIKKKDSVNESSNQPDLNISKEKQAKSKDSYRKDFSSKSRANTNEEGIGQDEDQYYTIKITNSKDSYKKSGKK